MGASHQTGADIDRLGGSFPRPNGNCALHANPQFVAFLTQHETDPFVGERHVVEISLHRVGGRDLRHRSVVTALYNRRVRQRGAGWRRRRTRQLWRVPVRTLGNLTARDQTGLFENSGRAEQPGDHHQRAKPYEWQAFLHKIDCRKFRAHI